MKRKCSQRIDRDDKKLPCNWHQPNGKTAKTANDSRHWCQPLYNFLADFVAALLLVVVVIALVTVARSRRSEMKNR